MNLAFPALCILLLAIPGVLFRKAFARAAVSIGSFKGKRSHLVNKYPVSIRPMTEEISISLVSTVILHICWLTLWTYGGLWSWFGLPEGRLNYGHIVRVLHGSSSLSAPGTSGASPGQGTALARDVVAPPALPAETAPAGSAAPRAGVVAAAGDYNAALDYLAEHRKAAVAYFLSLYAFSFLTGRGCLELVRRFKLDHRWMLVRLEDQWFYFLRGEIFNFSEFRQLFYRDGERPPEICGTYISLVVAQSGKDYLYKGFLWDFHLDREGKLDRLVLHHVLRATFAPDPAPKKSRSYDYSKFADKRNETPTSLDDDVRIEDGQWNFQRVSSQLFTVRYADCKTLACTYFYIRKKKEAEG